jgi:OmcA/MtrC family decaheme c-type cytochrome
MTTRWKTLLTATALAAVFALSGCGSDGADGAPGAPGADGADGADGIDATINPVDMAKAESCSTCHGGVGDKHQAVYDQYSDASAFDLTIVSVASTALGTVPETYDVTMTFTIDKDGLPYIDADGLPSLDQARFYVTGYDSAATDGNQFPMALNFSLSNPVATGTAGEYTVSATGRSFAVEASSGFAYAYIADGVLPTEGMTLYGDVANAGLAFGDADTYASAANVSSCETCHGAPYMKHGYRAAAVTGLADFEACKVCHLDDRSGTHEDWQYMVDEPYNWATDVPATADYSYTRKLMNDVHMSHAMEFPYPQSMANCATCHAGKLDVVLAEGNFTATTCKSCHAVQGIDRWESYTDASGATVPAETYAGEYTGRAPALEFLWTRKNLNSVHTSLAITCTDCHNSTAGAPAREFKEIHSGYDARITDPATGTKYAATYTASIDAIDVTDNVVTVDFSVSDADMVPYVYLSFYGWDSKNMIVASHSRDANSLRYEAKPDDTNALFVFTPNTLGATSYTAVMDLATYVPVGTDDIATLIANGVIKTGMVTIAPRYTTADGVGVGLDAVYENFDVADGSEVADYFPIDNSKCETCHDKLAVTFHGASGRSKVEVCRNCHVTTSGGSHLEMQSRSIDSYVHAVHSFQAFDSGDVDFTDPVEKAWYDLHVEHTFPNFTITNCEACHVAGTFNVPDQSKSMPGLLSGSDTWNVDRAIGTVPPYITGPASRACGGCHRADLINEDAAGALASFNAHTEMGGTLVDATDDDGTILYAIIDKIMGWFQ